MNQQDRDEFIILKEDVKHIKESITELEEIKQSLRNIERHLFNDGNTGEIGIVQLTKRNSTKLSAMEKRYAIAVGVISGIFLFIGRYLSKFI